MRHGGIVRDAAVLSAIGIGPDERRRVLGVSVALSEAEVHWRAFLESLQARGLRGVEHVVCDDHAGLRAARRAVLGGATWQRCQFHLARDTPSITRRASPPPSASAPSCARSGTPALWPRPKPPWRSWSRITGTPPRNSPHGWRKTCQRAWPSSPCPSITAADCIPRTRWNAPSEPGAQAPNEQGQGLPQRDLARAPRQRRAGRDRRQVGRRRQGLHQVGMPGCVISAPLKFQTSGCSIGAAASPRSISSISAPPSAHQISRSRRPSEL